MKIFRWFMIASVVAASNVIARAGSDTDKVASQFRQYCLQESTDHGQRLLDDVELPTSGVAEALRLVSSLGEDGSWPDIQYASKARSAWEPGDHLTRILSMIVRARRTDTPPADVAICVAGVHRALSFWIAHDFKCPNWWYNDIGGPKILGNVALLLGDDLKPDELNYIAGTVLARSKVGSMTGQNRVWLAGNGIMRALLLHDDALLEKAVGVVQDEITVSTGAEGIQPDWSFHQHGPQLQFGNYGLAFAVETSRWATVLRDTVFAISPEKMQILRNYLLQGQAWVSWHDMMDISSCGRQLFPNSQEKKAGVIRATMRSMEISDPAGQNEYRAFTTRTAADAVNDLVGTRVFWRSDDVVDRRAEFAATLKMSSPRVIGGETVNSEDLSGARLADGAMYLYRTGHEYENIFPVWDWRKIPGTTSALDAAPLSWTGKNERSKEPDFVGGVTDGTDGCGAMDFHRDKLVAKKSWFFIDDNVICLGAGITSTDRSPVVTTLNQCLLNGPIVAQVHGQRRTLHGAESKLKDVEWIEHDGFRYEFPVPQSLLITAGPQTGNWHRVFSNPSSPKADVTENEFTLCVDHGSAPQAGSYEYTVVPAGHTEPPAIRIVSNTEKVQAVESGDHRTAAVFWTPRSVDFDGISVAVDRPCVLMMNTASGTPRMMIADPTQKLKQIAITVGGRSKTIELPGGGDAGRSISVN